MIDFRQILLDGFLKKKKINPSYSIRAYARDLDCCHSLLSKVLKNTFKPSARLIFNACLLLEVSDKETIDQLRLHFEKS